MPQILDYSPNVKIERSGNFVDTGDPKLHNLNNIDSDDYNQRLSTAQSMSVGAYELTNFIPNDCGQKNLEIFKLVKLVLILMQVMRVEKMVA